jgi:hypothetical protein
VKLFHIFQSVNNDYDTFDSAVVVAETAEDAKKIHPNGDCVWDGSKWMRHLEDGRVFEMNAFTWCTPEDVMAFELGDLTDVDYTAGNVICASFNAG